MNWERATSALSMAVSACYFREKKDQAAGFLALQEGEGREEYQRRVLHDLREFLDLALEDTLE